MDRSNIFMTGNWQDLIMSTFEIDKSILEPYLPLNTQIDFYKEKALISLVAFTFSKVNFFGFKIPFHQHFGQINFRFYVKSKLDGSRGVVFIKEFAPKHLIAFVGNKFYNEPYFYKNIKLQKKKTDNHTNLQYSFQNSTIKVSATRETEELKANTLKHFVVDRYIAYIKSRKLKTVRYNIYHRPWRTYKLNSSFLDETLLTLLPSKFKGLKLISTYFIDGSKVNVEKGVLK